jgi:ParB-like chromosome segregation protein Spo0J
MTELPYHPIADAFKLPLIEGAEFDALVEDIRANGQCEAITVYQNMILDGRNRNRACIKLGIEPRLNQFIGDDKAARAFVISKNLHRRHLTAEKRRELIAEQIKAQPEKSNRRIAKQVDVSHPHVAKGPRRDGGGGRRGNRYHVDRHQGPEAAEEAQTEEQARFAGGGGSRFVGGGSSHCRYARRGGVVGGRARRRPNRAARPE